MILRDAIFSAERRHLGAQPAASPVLTPPAEHVTTLLATEVREPAAGYEPRGAEGGPPARHVESPLSSDRVASWLVTQDGATRTALAALLSEKLAAVRDAARNEGYEHGHREAMQEAREKVQGALEALAEMNEGAEAAFDSEVAQLGDICTDIVAEVFFKL